MMLWILLLMKLQATVPFIMRLCEMSNLFYYLFLYSDYDYIEGSKEQIGLNRPQLCTLLSVTGLSVDEGQDPE